MSRFRIATILASLSCALLFILGQPARADELQDITKLYRQGQNDKALERLDSYLTSRPKNAQGPEIAQARFLKGLILADMGKNAEAIQTFTKLTEDYPELPEPYNNLGVLYANQGQYEKSRLALEMAISTHGSYATAHENLGDIYAKMASQAYDKALQLDKGNVTAQTKLALIKELVSVSGKGTRASTKPEIGKVALAPAAVTPAAAPPKPEPPKAAPSAAATPSPAKTEAARPAPPAPVTADAEAAALKTLDDWAKAWSGKNVAGYLANYASTFKAPGGESRAAWEKARGERLTTPKSISVVIGSPRATLTDASHARVTFRQNYKSETFSASAQKTLILVKSGEKWLIEEELVGR